MTDNRYRDRYGRDRQRDRSNSIFSDDDNDRSRGGQGDERGFFNRAGDEVRSWFGDEEAERRREQDERRYEREQGSFGGYQPESFGRGRQDYAGAYGRTYGGSGDFGGSITGQRPQGWGEANQGGWRGGRERQTQSHYGTQHATGGSQGTYGREGPYGTSQGFYGGSQASFGDRSFGGSPHDANYHSWRSQQMEQFDCDYADYCRERQQQFDSDFSSWRQNRRQRQSGSGGSDLTGSSGTTGSAGTSGVLSQASETAGTGSSPGSSSGTRGRSKA